ncbi:hydroxyacid dehydrogenase [Streptomyces zhihengii]|uniref:hydroxyacid dehydrogenase n=1 Tax=Streptomyces zhihengii TaxID=1818004 RepID=UPI003637BFEB
MPHARPSARPRVAVVLRPDAREQLFGPEQWETLCRTGDVVAECADAGELLAHPRRAEAEVLLASWGAPLLTAGVLAHLPALRTVLYGAGSIRLLVTDACWERGLTVVSAAEANNGPVAEYVYAQTVLALKDVHRRSRRMAAERVLPGLDGVPGIHGQTVGLVSFGSIARMVAGHLRRLGTRVLAWDPYADEALFREAGAERVAGLPELVARSRVLSIHTPLVPGRTEGLVTGELLRGLPHGATLINTARGAVVDEEALIRVLGERPDLQAVLDVTAEEPPSPGSALYTLENVMLTGHVAGTVGSERRAIGALLVEELTRVAAGEPPLHAVSPEASLLRA